MDSNTNARMSEAPEGPAKAGQEGSAMDHDTKNFRATRYTAREYEEKGRLREAYILDVLGYQAEWFVHPRRGVGAVLVRETKSGQVFRAKGSARMFERWAREAGKVVGK